MKFSEFNLSDEIKRGLKDLEYTNMTEVQEKTLGESLLNKDLIVKAQTGSGKTAAFSIPLCEMINREDTEKKALIIAPTRELAIQIADDIKNISRYKLLKVATLIGKESFKEQESKLKGNVHIIVGTPGRVLDHLDEGTLNGKFIKYLVIDEADEMFNMGFIGQVEGICKRVNKNRVTQAYSATIKNELETITKNYMDRPKIIECSEGNMVKDSITHGILVVEGLEKLDMVDNILLSEKPNKSIIFCRTKENVDIAYKYFKDKGYSVDKIHGDMLQKERNEKMENFRDGNSRILIATDIAARGIDIEDITHVISIDIPVEKESYVHRIGRTGRAKRKGKSITLMTPYEEKYLNRIEEYIGYKIPEYEKMPIENREESLKILKSRVLGSVNKKKNIKGITKIYLNGGKKKKIRKIDIVGTICTIPGIEKDDIGMIEVLDNGSTIEIFNNKGDKVLKELKNKTIKGKNLKVEKARK